MASLSRVGDAEAQSERPRELREDLAHGGEAHAVVRRRAEPEQRRPMLAGAVADVPLEAILWEVGGQRAHQPVAGDLGDDRGGGDRQAERIAADDATHPAGQGRGALAVDQRELAGKPSAATARCIASIVAQ